MLNSVNFDFSENYIMSIIEGQEDLGLNLLILGVLILLGVLIIFYEVSKRSVIQLRKKIFLATKLNETAELKNWFFEPELRSYLPPRSVKPKDLSLQYKVCFILGLVVPLVLISIKFPPEIKFAVSILSACSFILFGYLALLFWLTQKKHIDLLTSGVAVAGKIIKVPVGFVASKKYVYYEYNNQKYLNVLHDGLPILGTLKSANLNEDDIISLLVHQQHPNTFAVYKHILAEIS